VTRLTGASKNTVTKLVVDAGRACLDYQNRTFINLTCKRKLWEISDVVAILEKWEAAN
jgi:hypothetical protein